MSTTTLAPTTAVTGPRPVADTVTMFRRNLLRQVRYPTLAIFTVAIPVVLLLLFIYAFGGAFGAGVVPGVAPGAEGRVAFLDYITPAILMFALVGGAQGVAISVAMDRTAGITDRFRTMAVSSGSVLAGPVLGTVVQAVLAAAVTLVVAVAMGFRPGAGPLDWLALFGVLILIATAVIWLCVGMGLSARSVESSSNTPMILTLLPFLSSGFVPTDTMPAGIRWFAEYQPFTPFIETVRGLLAGTGVETGMLVQALAWGVGLAVVGYVWSVTLYRRRR